MRAQLDECGMSYERVPAVDGRQLAERTDLTHISSYGLPVTASEIGCMLSHRRAWLQFLRSGEDLALILEDDVNIGRGLTEIAKADLSQISSPCIINCETRFNSLELLRPKKTLPGLPHNLWPIYATVGAGGYLIGRSAAAILRRELRKMHPVDHLLFGKLKGRPWHSLKVFQLSPAFIKPNDLLAATSDIELDRQNIADEQEKFWKACKPKYFMKLLREAIRVRVAQKSPVPFR